MPIPTPGTKTLTEIIEEQKKYENDEFFDSIFFEEGGKVDDFYNKCSTIYDGIAGQVQAARDVTGRNAGVLKTVNNLTAEDKSALASEGIEERDIPKWAAINYNIRKIGTSAKDMPVEKWYDELVANKGGQMAKMLARRLQLKFLNQFKASMPKSVDVTFEVTEGTGFMGKVLKYRPIEFIIKKKDGTTTTKTVDLDGVDEVVEGTSLENSNGDKNGFEAPDVETDTFFKKLKQSVKIIDAKDFKVEDVKKMEKGNRAGIITIENKMAQDVPTDLGSEYTTYIADFGNALRPGGGTVQGASAQEESLFQCYPDAFPSLVAAKEYYDANNEELDRMASEPRNKRRAAKILVKRDLIKEIAGGKYGEKLQAEAEKVMSAKSDERDSKINEFLAGLRANETREDFATLDKIIENANGEYSKEIQDKAKKILLLQSDTDKKWDESANKWRKDDKIKKMRKAMKELYSEMHLEIKHSVDISKDIDTLIEEKQTKEASKVKELSLELVKRNGFRRIITIAPAPKLDESNNEVGTKPGMIVINAPDLRTVIPSLDKKIAGKLIAFERDEGKVLNDMPEEERNKKFNELAGQALAESKNEINEVVKESLTQQIGQGLLNVIASMEEDKKYAVVLGAVGCGVFKCDPNVVAGVFKDLLIDNDGLRTNFDKIIFAIYEPNGVKLGKAFKDVLQIN